LGYRSYSVIAQEVFKGSSLDTEAAVQNSAKQPFNNPPTIEKFNTVIRWTQKERSWFDPGNAANMMNTVNSTSTRVVGITIGAKKGLLRNASPELKRDENGDNYYETTYEVELSTLNRGWYLVVRDQGFQKIGVGLKPEDITKGDVNPSLLTGTATQKAEAAEKINDPADLTGGAVKTTGGVGYKADYLYFQVYRETNWGSLDLLSSVT